MNLFDQTAASYQKLLQGSQTGDELALREGEGAWRGCGVLCLAVQSCLGNLLFGCMLIIFLFFVGQLTWLIYLIGSVIGGRVDRYYSSDSDAIDGQLISRWVSFFYDCILFTFDYQRCN